MAGDTRTLGISLDRVIGATGERTSWPAVSYPETPLPHRVQQGAGPGVQPVAAGDHAVRVGRVRQRRQQVSDFDAGADIFWKPNGRFQLSATLNPDFGQVESDQLVVNFSAHGNLLQRQAPVLHREPELLRRAVRLAQHQQPADLHPPRRRARPTTARDAGDVTAAVKLNGSMGRAQLRRVRRDRGRRRSAATSTRCAPRRDGETQGLGAMVTRVSGPCYGQDVTRAWSARPTSTRSTIAGRRIRSGRSAPRWWGRTSTAWARTRQPARRRRGRQRHRRPDAHRLGHGRRLAPAAVHAAPRRQPAAQRLRLSSSATTSTTRATTWRKRFTDLPRNLAVQRRRLALAPCRVAINDHGLHIADAAAINRSGQLRDGGNDFFEIATWTSGHDDLITPRQRRGRHAGEVLPVLRAQPSAPGQRPLELLRQRALRIRRAGHAGREFASSSTSSRPTTSTTASASSPPGTSSTTRTGCCGAAATCWAASTRT